MKPTIMYLISGDDDIKASFEAVLSSGRRVLHDMEVNVQASAAIRKKRRYVVIAHGSKHGTVQWYRSDTATSARWLWVGMPSPPTGARIYLYSCHAGEQLSAHLQLCQCFGHSD